MTIIDAEPLEFLERKQVVNVPNEPKAFTKKTELQKVLQKSSNIKKQEESSKELDLESFLQGFI